MKRVKLVLLCFLAVVIGLAVAACGGKEDPGTDTPTDPPEPAVPVIEVSIDGTAAMYVGDTAELVVTATEDGTPVEATLSVASGSDVVSLSGTTVTALKSGTAVIRATFKEETAEFTVTVSDLVDLRFDRTSYELGTFDLAADNTVTIEVSGIMNGLDMTADQLAGVTWSSSDETVAAVAAGTVTFKKEGTATVTASYGAASVSAAVTCIDYSSYTQISTKEQLLAAGKAFTNIDGTEWTEGTKYYLGKYVLTADIDMGGENIGDSIFDAYFIGTFDGNGHKIYNFDKIGGGSAIFWHIGGDNTPAGNSGLVRNLTVACNTFSPSGKTGLLAQTAWGKGVVENCYVYADEIRAPSMPDVSNAANGVGLTVVNVYNGGTVRNCVEAGNWVEGDTAAGFRRIGYNQNGSANYDNNYSIITNIPDDSTVSDTANITAIDYTADIFLYVGEAAALPQAAGCTFAFESADPEVAAIADGLVTGVNKGATYLSAAVSVSGKPLTGNGTAVTVKVPVYVASGLLAPDAVSFNGSLLSWNEVSGAASYKVSVTPEGGEAQESEALTATSFDMSAFLTEGGKYSVRVQALDGEGRTDGYGDALTINAIATKDQLAAVTNDKTANYLLIDDINLDGAVDFDIADGNFTGTFDGNGHKIYNFNVAVGWQGLFYNLGGAKNASGVIRNVTAHCTSFTTNTKNAILVAAVWGAGAVVENCTVIADEMHLTAAAQSNRANGTGLLAVTVLDGGVIRNCTEVGTYASGTNAAALTRIAYAQGQQIFENNLSVYYNVPAGAFNSDTVNNVAADYTQAAVEIEVDDTVQLASLDGYTLTYASEDDEIATVSETGLVTGVAGGTTTILVTVADTGIVLKVPVAVRGELDTPTGLAFGGSVISWNAVDGATSYQVTVSSGDGSQTLTANEAQCDIAEALTAGGEYAITVKALAAGSESADSAALVLNAVQTKDQLAAVTNDKAANYLLIDDIDLEAAENFVIADGNFTGVFDGDGHKIYNFSVNAGWKALFYHLGGATNASGVIRNVTAHCTSFTTNTKNAILVAAVYGAGAVVDNCTVIADEMHLTAAAQSNRANGTGLLAVTTLDGGVIRNCTEVGTYASGANAAALTRIAYAQGQQIFENNLSVYYNVPAGAFNSDTVNNVAADYNQAAVTIGVEETAQLASLDGYTLTYASEDDEIATVSETGLVTGVAEGDTAVIVSIASDGETVATLSVPVSVTAAAVIEAPENVTFNGSIISWNAVDGATSYRVTVTFGETPQTYTAEETQYDIAAALTQEGAYTITVKAISADAESADSTALVLNGIKTPEALDNLDSAGDPNDSNRIKGNYILIGDIDFGGKAVNPDNGFQKYLVNNEINGILDGNGYAIKNFSLANSENMLFRTLGGTGVIRNLTVQVNEYQAHGLTSPFVGTSWGGTIMNVDIYVNKLVGQSAHQGIAGLVVAELRGDPSTLTDIHAYAVWTNETTHANFNLFGKLTTTPVMTDCSALLVNAPEALNVPTVEGLTVTRYAQTAVEVEIDGNVQLASLDGYTLTYASQDDEIATVNGTGLVTGVAEGETAVTVTIASGGETVATLSVPVSVTAAA